jgi:hypothetical protein
VTRRRSILNDGRSEKIGVLYSGPVDLKNNANSNKREIEKPIRLRECKLVDYDGNVRAGLCCRNLVGPSEVPNSDRRIGMTNE